MHFSAHFEPFCAELLGCGHLDDCGTGLKHSSLSCAKMFLAAVGLAQEHVDRYHPEKWTFKMDDTSLALCPGAAMTNSSEHTASVSK
jgi:hypothetical protein